jgi:hypothetical protein
MIRITPTDPVCSCTSAVQLLYPSTGAGKPGGWALPVSGRRLPVRGEQVPVASVAEDFQRLERRLFSQSLDALEADRSTCADCGRTPLTGEHVHLYESPRASEVVCELCRQLRRDAPVASEIVRHCEHGQTVRLTARAL